MKRRRPGTSSTESMVAARRMPQIQVEPAPDASPVGSGAPPIIVCWAAPASGTSSSPAEQAPPWTNEVFKVSAPGPADIEPTIRRMSEFRAKWGFGTAYAEPPEAQEAPDAHEADVDVGAAEQALPEPGADREPETTSWAIAELRRFSGLTWEQIAELFGVSRRSVHAWAGGSPLNARNEKHLRNTLDIIRHADRGLTKYNRAALLEKKGGVAPFDLLAEQKYDEARDALGKGIEWNYPPLPKLSPEARAARLPLRPEVLMDAHSGRIHEEETGRARGVRTVRLREHEDS